MAVAELEPLIGELRDKLGDDHVHLLMARHMFTLWAPDRAGATDGVAAWEALVEEETRVLGDKHPVTIAARQELAGWCADIAATRMNRAPKGRWTGPLRDLDMVLGITRVKPCANVIGEIGYKIRTSAGDQNAASM